MFKKGVLEQHGFPVAALQSCYIHTHYVLTYGTARHYIPASLTGGGGIITCTFNVPLAHQVTVTDHAVTPLVHVQQTLV